MFKHILIPTDGSELANIAVVNGVRFAKEIGAKVTGLTVTPPYHYVAVDAVHVGETEEQFTAEVKVLAERNLLALKEAAKAADVPVALVHASSDFPYEEIVKIAEVKSCDVIFLASHGRRGLPAIILGSETTKVLTHTKIPVLVYR
jgi:nucleotide-binding universal stress UspA family protein